MSLSIVVTTSVFLLACAGLDLGAELPSEADTSTAPADATDATDATPAVNAPPPAAAPADIPDLLALQAGGAVIASSGSYREPDYMDWLAIDDDMASDWCTPQGQTEGQFLVIDRGVSATFTGFSMQLSRSWTGEAPSSVTVSVSQAGPDGPWTEATTATVPEGAAESTIIEVPLAQPVAARSVRFTFGAPRGGQYVCLAAVRGRGTGESPPVTDDVTGDWYTGWAFATMHLRQTGGGLDGCYDKIGGELHGVLDGQVLLLDWSQPEAHGRMALRRMGPDKAIGVYQSYDDENKLWGASQYVQAERKGPPTGCAEAPPAPELSPLAKDLQDDGRARLDGILFDFGSARLRPESRATLDAVATVLASQQGPLIVEGHTDAVGDDASNLSLSDARAKAVVAYLVEKGVPADRLEPVGKGETAPVASNDDAQGRAFNRRVELVRKG